MKPHIIKCKDESILIEWIDKNQRFGISLEKDRKESSWYFVSKDGTTEGGELPEELLNLFRENTK